MKKILLLICVCVFESALCAQVPVGQFKSHLPYNGFHAVAVAPDCIYAATESSIAYMDRKSESMNCWSKIDGLSEVGISDICFDKETDVLIVAYTSSNIDFIHDGKVKNIPDIKNKQMSGSKRINNIVVKEGVAYLMSAFGVVLVDLKRFLILDTWYTNLNGIDYSANDLLITDEKFYLATDSGIFSIDKNSQLLPDFTQWTKMKGLPEGSYSQIKEFNHHIYVCHHVSDDVDSIYKWQEGSWIPSPFSVNAVRSMDVVDDEMLVCYWSFIQIYDKEEQSVYYSGWNGNGSYEDASQGVMDGDFVWIADRNLGLVKINRKYGSINTYTADGPHSEMVYALDAQKGMVVVTSGSNLNWSPKYLSPDLSYYYQYQWNTISKDDNPELNNCDDLVEVAINPRQLKEYYAGSWGYGLFHYLNGKLVEHYDASNSMLKAFSNEKTFVSGLAYDNNNNLWITNSYSDLPLLVIKSDNTWAAFDLKPYVNGNVTVVDQVMVDSRNYKWITVPRENRLIVFSDNNTLNNENDDQIVAVNLNGYSNIQTTAVNCIAEDLDGEVWIGTDLGIKVIYNPDNIFGGGAFAQNILLEQDGYVQNLLQYESVTCIAVDGANRKWIGTAKAGAFLMSADGKEELLNLSESNSALFSNQIYDIAINHETGDVFFATDKGLISYRGTATAGRESYDEVKVFPNPVRENYSGVIAVSGLKNHSFCKVVDSAGMLVWQSYANGGELIWDGKNFSGTKVATGVYFVFSSDETGKEKQVAKILFIK